MAVYSNVFHATFIFSYMDPGYLNPIKIINLVPMAGVEPAQLSPLPPQDSVSTNSTTSASN